MSTTRFEKDRVSDHENRLSLQCHRRLVGFRERHKLDDVVKGAKTEFEKMPLKVAVDELPFDFTRGPSYSGYQSVSSTDEKQIAYIAKKLRGCFFFRIIPRNDFLSNKYPLPLNQGVGAPWPWNGYINWSDEHTPRLRQYSRFVHKKGDMYWTLN